ncbi:extensin-like domain-containing protein [Sphingopyxis yananensis]|uniref:extensin-like domain-containing protein n=1 Tax=Sphingopyxis yananensis TaxID=2886687 RepID=UPI001D119001|nr:extensin family protein [Sphingopyxis yananensis]MCC2602081.1 extensin family protein [Sphingopyxis yananensis]
MTRIWPYIFAFVAVIAATLGAIWVMQWVREHPQHFRHIPLALSHEIGAATPAKLADLTQDEAACFAVMDAAQVSYERRPVVGEGSCRASQRMIMSDKRLFPAMTPARAAPSCAVSAGMILWQRDVVGPMAHAFFGQKVVRVENLGSYNCRNIAGASARSEHSRANAIDISAFVLADGTRISLKDDWADDGDKGAFLRSVRDGACDIFTTTLSPDYNAAHADHFHLDLAQRTGGWSLCR